MPNGIEPNEQLLEAESNTATASYLYEGQTIINNIHVRIHALEHALNKAQEALRFYQASGSEDDESYTELVQLINRIEASLSFLKANINFTEEMLTGYLSLNPEHKEIIRSALEKIYLMRRDESYPQEDTQDTINSLKDLMPEMSPDFINVIGSIWANVSNPLVNQNPKGQNDPVSIDADIERLRVFSEGSLDNLEVMQFCSYAIFYLKLKLIPAQNPKVTDEQ